MTAMRERCAGCAFREGSRASQDRFVAIKVALCLESRTPFFCHENAVEDVIPDGEARVCRGYLDAVADTARAGTSERARDILRWAADVDAGRLGAVPDGIPVVEVP